ncbi:hypothetical protein BH24ACT2_BH24ACT2_07430 [soil metagenome]
MLRSLMLGAAAGAAGTTALNVVTYLDMLTRARPASSTPEQTVEVMAERAGVAVPGDDDARSNRLSALGAMSGIAAGVGVGAAYGLARGLGWRPSVATGAVLATFGALIGTNGPMTVLGVTDPRTWAAVDWVSDIVPHLAYGAVTAATYAAGEQP